MIRLEVVCRRLPARHRSERGAIAVLVGILGSALLMSVAAFAVDIGMQRAVRSDMQAVADMVALDLSQLVDGRNAAVIIAGDSSHPSLATARDRSVARNSTGVDATPSLDVRLVDLDSTGKPVRNPTTGEVVSLTAASDIPDAVWVRASGSVAFSFRPGDGGASRTAIAGVASSACYKLGSWAAQVNTNRSQLINPVLRKMAEQSGAFTNGGTVSALDYMSLASANVDLLQLATRLNVGTVEQLASATVLAKNLYVHLAALASPSNTTTVNLLNTLQAVTKTTTTVQMGKILGLKSGAGALAAASANVLDIVGGSIAALNGTNVANIYLGAQLSSMTNVNLAVRLSQGAHQYCGAPGSTSTIGVRSDTEQLNIHIDGTLNPTIVDFPLQPITNLLTNIKLARITAENHVSLDLSAAGTESILTGLACGAGAKGISLDVRNGLATVTISTPLRAEVRARLLGLGALGLNIAEAVISVNAAVTLVARLTPSSNPSMTVTVPPQAYDTPYVTSSGSVSILSWSKSYANISANVELLGGALGAWINLTTPQQNQLIDAILGTGLTQLLSPTDPRSLSTTVFDPLLGLIGARVGGSNVMLDSSPPVSCGTPGLRG
ncbi:hypothetical protein [Nocardioides sp. R-C-SC26]|uniref:hypothetical protein n=1 Tax=Nocardioides sp. R-C-SC26 TaxID=2870414 RepID=UPI001E34A5CC|nr:hypothetical protein [Nocardioides sp. R-C-SC26]